MIKAISFDLWDTLIHDDSDEPKRRAQGLRSKHEERRHLVWEALNQEHEIARETVETAYDVAEMAFNKVWRDHYITWTVPERIRLVLRGLGHDLGDEAFRHVVQAHEEMEIEISPEPMEGIAAALDRLSKSFRIAVVSDAIVCPGRGLRQILNKHGLGQYFAGFAFSDEVGHSKPHRAMFASAAQQLGVEMTEMVHVGDRDHNDVKGPHAHGMKAILFTATRSTDKDTSSADAICEHASELPAIIERLTGPCASR